MASSRRLFGVGLVIGLFSSALLQAQYPSELVGFNGPPIDDPATAKEMFRTPEFSGTTSGYVVPNSPDSYDHNAAFRASGLQTEGVAALEVYFEWVDPADPEAWVRLTTFNGAERPNPALDTRGKVRFKLTNRSELFRGEIGVCIGIRETGAGGVAQLDDGGTSGPIEWVGVDGVVTDPNDPNTVLGPVPTITLPPSASAYELEWDLSTGAVSIGGTPQGGGIAGFTGNGTLADCPENRGTLEHVAITNLAGDIAVLIDFAIDELQFEATVPDPTPPPSIRAPVVETDTQVEVECIPDADEAELFLNDASQGTVAPIDGVATFDELTLIVGDVLTATQTANGVTSDLSAPVVVYAEGTALAEDFDGYATQDELETLWTQTDPSNDRKVLLSTGSASSCQNFVVSNYLPGPPVSRLYYSLGSIDGTDADPLIVTYRFKHDTNSTEARARFELTPSSDPATRAHGALGFAFSNGIGGAFGEQYTSMTNSPSPIIEGYVSDYFLYDYALTGIERVPGVWHKMQIEVLTDVVNFYIDDELANPIDPNTGLPVWPDGVPRVNQDDFRYIVLGVGYSNNGPAMMYDDLSVTIGGTELPFGDPNPVESPSVGGPLFPGGDSVEVSELDPNASLTTVYADASEIGTAPGPFPTGMATVDVSGLYDGQKITATQTLNDVESCYSWPVVVGVPAPRVEPVLLPEETTVEVSEIEEGLASLVTVYQDVEGDLVLLGTEPNPASDPIDVTVPALQLGMIIVATQTIGDTEGPPSDPVVVQEPGLLGPWIQTSSLPTGLTDHQLVELDGYLYCLGGRSNVSPQATDSVYYAPINSDGSLGEWQETTFLPGTRATPAAAAYNGRVYVWGGWAVGWPTMNTCWYAEQNPDGTLGSWTTSAVTIPDNTDVSPPGTQMDAMGRGVMIFGDKLYIINGEWDNGSSFGNTNNCYYSTINGDGDYSPWVLTTPTETFDGSWFHGVAAIAGTTENYMYRVAGNYRGTTESNMYRTTIEADGSLGTWVQDPADLPEARYEIACAVADNTWLFAICGLFGATPQNTVYYTAIDPDTGELGTWETGPEYPETVSRNCAVSYSAGGATYILVAGGGPYSGSAGERTPNCYYALVGGAAAIPGDVDGDGDVDLSDLAALLAAYRACEGDPDYDPGADFDGSGCVDLSDLATLLANYGTGT